MAIKWRIMDIQPKRDADFGTLPGYKFMPTSGYQVIGMAKNRKIEVFFLKKNGTKIGIQELKNRKKIGILVFLNITSVILIKKDRLHLQVHKYLYITLFLRKFS